ncbi:hypothetical protein LWC35_04150 [Pseudonocardia kujensis]|uniref:hypothetical protein n=1 Tax=Pseudonocardia kujensis TaxID=1128675 RepID=UPI001E59727B|nr:hypothetical protein [Pseudonocardia kujensis]MCE0762107.1 hypothetical protein [Pseudonocardia kujensis]
MEIVRLAGPVQCRVSAFVSDQALLMSEFGVAPLPMAGFVTSGVVLSAVHHSSDSHVEIAVQSDACGNADPEVLRVLIEKVFPACAEVATVKEPEGTL